MATWVYRLKCLAARGRQSFLLIFDILFVYTGCAKQTLAPNIKHPGRIIPTLFYFSDNNPCTPDQTKGWRLTWHRGFPNPPLSIWWI